MGPALCPESICGSSWENQNLGKEGANKGFAAEAEAPTPRPGPQEGWVASRLGEMGGSLTSLSESALACHAPGDTGDG